MLTKKDNNFYKNFGHNDPILNWAISKNDSVHSKNITMAEGYYEAAVCLIDECLSDSITHKGDTWIFPIMFCVNQFIELYLKAIYIQLELIRLGEVDDTKVQIEKSHNLGSLLKTVINKFNQVFPEKANAKSCFYEVEEFISIIEKPTDIEDPKAYNITSFRYPTGFSNDNTNIPQFYNREVDNFGVNLRQYKEWVFVLHNTFDGKTGELCDMISKIKG